MERDDPDVRLMLAFRAGDDSALSDLYRRWAGPLLRFLERMVKERATAEELLQESFIRVHQAKDRYEPEARFSTWLFRIAHNLANNRRRDDGRRKEVGFGGSDGGPRPEEQILKEKSGLMPTRQLDKSELQKVVQESLETLNDRQRMAVLLHKFEGMSYSDIAEAMELTPAAVKSLLSRARESLRGKLEPYVK